ncbi:structure-specific endonuclease subunit SLX4 isoform 3-T4 [Callospermophilus lateralis]|uniref:structure-specific endonuclease subunit SLX4 isoform X3 n=1 Tax=Callospermophilus lateralis TaxID=76772 RepID=UPI004038CC27
MMDESDDDFKELCANFFQRVKKNGTKEVSGEKKTQKASNSTQIRNKLKKNKQSTTKSKTLPGPARKKPKLGSQDLSTKKPEATKLQENEQALSVNGEGGVLAPALNQPNLCERAQSIQTAVPSPSKPRTAELVLQRMQQFKRADPERLRHASGECSVEAALEENSPQSPQEEMVAGNGYEPRLPATDNDAAVALALQQEFGREAASAHNGSLEENGLFFCQMCQKNLSAMNVTRREQHVNRCLDEAEKALKPSIPQIPECPICGKPFLSSKSRISHLKQCAVKMEVGPQLLLQAARLQTAQLEAGGSLPVPSSGSHTRGLKRKGATNKKEPQKRRKVSKPSMPSEDLLVAMALSRSEIEQCPAVPALILENAFSERMRPGAEKKSRKKKPLASPPQLLVQDSETTGRQIEDRVAQLLSEEVELSSTPPLPASRIFKEEWEEAGWHLQLPEGKRNFLWEGSALTGAWAVESFYTMGLVPPIVPQQPAKDPRQEPELPLVLWEQPEPSVQKSPALHGSHPAGLGPRNPLLSASQREHQALQDLMDLAEEGLSGSPWPCSGVAGIDSVPSSLPLTGFVLPFKEKPPERGDHTSVSLGLLAADFSAMVNNPHLSDVQFQMDSGEVLYAHKFVLYARCPLLIQYVNNEGFSAVEDGDVTQRVLLSNVSFEAACAFLHYLYTADASLPPCLVPALSSLALRFGVNDLVHLCEQVPVLMDSEGEQQEKEDENCDSRVESLQELLRAVWADEEEEEAESHQEDRVQVNEAEMEEIYEFAATQRKLLQWEREADTEEDSDYPREDSPVAGPVLGRVQSDEQLEKQEQSELSGPGKEEASATWGNAPHSLPLLPGLRSVSTGEAETHEQEVPTGAPGPSPSGGCQAGGKEGFLLHPVKIHNHQQACSSTQGSELSQIMSSPEEQSGTVRERQVEMACPLAPQQISLPHPCYLLSQPPGGASRVASPGSLSPLVPLRQKRDNSFLTSLSEPGHWKGKGCSSMLEGKTKGVPISPEKSSPIDLTQSQPDHLSTSSQDLPSHLSKENEIILLLDSDEELELEQTKTKSISNDLPEERKVLEFSPRSSELFSVIDVDADQECCSPLKEGAGIQREEEEGELENQDALGRGMVPWLLCDQESSLHEDSTDTSWLVPATPLASKSRDCSSQTQITSLVPRTPGDKTGQHMPNAASENRAAQEAAQSSVIMPQMSPVTPGASDSGRQVYRSPSGPRPRYCSLSSPRAQQPGIGGLTDVTSRFQKLSPLGPFLLNQAAASEVVEVGDSEDEQEMASHQGNSSPLQDSDPSVPVDDCCWHVEPLSPIPIDHLNLERTGPLSTSSPSGRAHGALDSSDCHSPGLPSTTPVGGSCAARREPQQQSPQAGSSGSSFLNTALWDNWDGEEQKSPEASPVAQTPSAHRAQRSEGPETPKGVNQKKNLPPKVPITPMPRYSIMETPLLKKELDRFGVRPLPKRQMILKLKEIFQYTHQTLESDSEDEIQSSQVPLEAPCSQTLTTETYRPSRAGHTQSKATTGPRTQRSKGPTKAKGPRHPKHQPGESIPHPRKSAAKEPSPGPDGDAQLPASQESVATYVDGSDSSFSSQSSSSCEFGATFESAGEDAEGEEAVSASQAAVQAVDTEEAVRRYIHSTPALYRKVLTYQPLELAELQAELKQNGIRVATGKLLDVLDAHCITFTTAAARKEKLKQKGRRRVGRKRGEWD